MLYLLGTAHLHELERARHWQTGRALIAGRTETEPVAQVASNFSSNTAAPGQAGPVRIVVRKPFDIPLLLATLERVRARESEQ